MKRADIIIPVYKPDGRLLRLLDMLMRQTVEAERIFLVNTERRYFDEFVSGTDFWQRYRNDSVKHISRSEDDHGNHRTQ